MTTRETYSSVPSFVALNGIERSNDSVSVARAFAFGVDPNCAPTHAMTNHDSSLSLLLTLDISILEL